jgi:hypothetical protein
MEDKFKIWSLKTYKCLATYHEETTISNFIVPNSNNIIVELKLERNEKYVFSKSDTKNQHVIKVNKQK